MTGRIWMMLGALAGLLAVGMAAWSAHGLPQRLGADALQSVRSAVQMQGWHALALLACGLFAARSGALTHAAGAAFALGLALFCGAVYAQTLAGLRAPMLAPAGGLFLMLGWLLLGLSAAFSARS